MTKAAAIRLTAMFWAALTILPGCGEEAKPPEKPAVVTKRIVVPDQKAKTPEAVEPEAGSDRQPEPDETQAAPSPQPAGKQMTIALISPALQKIRSPGVFVSYDPQGKIDPFTPLIRSRPVTAEDARPERKKRVPQTPLEKIDLGQLKLTAIVRMRGEAVGLVEEAGGKGYVIREGTYIGVHSGRVIKIDPERVVVEEEVEDVLGKVQTRHVDLRIQKPPGE